MSRMEYLYKLKNKEQNYTFDNLATFNDQKDFIYQARTDTPYFLEKFQQKNVTKTKRTNSLTVYHTLQKKVQNQQNSYNQLRNSQKQIKTLKKKLENLKNNKLRQSTKSYERPKTSFQNSRVAYDDFEKYQAQQKLKKVKSTCQRLAYTIGHLKAQLKQAVKKCSEEKQKRIQETKYLQLVAERYKAQAQKYKNIIKINNIAVPHISNLQNGIKKKSKNRQYS